MVFLRFKGAVQNLPEEDQMEAGRRLGALALHSAAGGIGDLPVAKGVGRIERVPVSNGGGCVSLVHPVSIYRKKKHPLNVPHLSSR